ncbi:ribosomal RNA-processing protein 8 isoform X1 [Anolis sagrei]|uniref:ribosomal RNA-processing protein 8 isoform X1 n=1 Tax=Anolis sagrei TaxID=38937 RepID=UPI0035222DE6
MFEEGEWDEGGTSVGTTAPWGTTKRAGKGPPAPSGSHQRLRLLATLRRLEGLGGAQKAPPSPTSSGSEGEEDEEGSGEEEEKPQRKRRKRKPRRTRQREEQPCLPSGAEKKGDHQQKQPGNNGEAAPSEPRTEPFTCRKTPGSEEGATKEEPKGPLLSRKQWRNRQKNKRRQKNKYKSPGDASAAGGAPADVAQPPDPGEPPGSPGKGSEGEAVAALPKAEGGRGASLRLRMEERLEAARFRFLNQQLYCRPSQEAGQLFKEDPQAFAIYHRGFARQMDHWPEKPVQRIVRYLRHRPASLVVADFGCGDCTLARSVRNQVHCFDLEALDPRVIVCDMSQVPLEDESVDVAVFCLALMGTNVQEILAEASRVLRMGGTLLVAEVASRFSDVRAFVGAVSALGFSLRAKDVSGSHFFSFEFSKAKPLPAKAKALPGLALRPCLYKRR